MDIKSGNGYPSSALSNFTFRPFKFDDVLCNSMEGFLQSLKFDKPHMQEIICKLYGSAAKFRGANKRWWRNQTLYWKGIKYDRHSQEYQDLLDRAYQAAFDQSDSFRRALKASGDAVVTHSVGKNDPSRTILTEREFCSRLTKLRGQLL